MKYCMQCGSLMSMDMVDGIQRQRCTNKKCRHIFWQNPVPVVAALVEYDGKILLARNSKWPSGLMSLVTGFLEQQETPDEAIRREIMEELNLNCKSVEFLAYYSLLALNQLILLFRVEAWGEVSLNYELAEYCLIDRESLNVSHFGDMAKLDHTIRQQAMEFRDWLVKMHMQ